MSRFNTHARELDRIVKEIFEKFVKADEQLKAAEKRADELKKHENESAENAAKSARAYADLIEARAAMQAARAEFEAGHKTIREIRKQLESDISEEYAAEPSRIDLATIELMKAGVMSSSEYRRIFDAARADGNHTMARIIAKYAEGEVDKAISRYGENGDVTSDFRQIVFDGKHENGGEYLEAFDSLVNVYNRAENNAAMIGYWDSLTSETVEQF